jgi:hypothetical protein
VNSATTYRIGAARADAGFRQQKPRLEQSRARPHRDSRRELRRTPDIDQVLDDSFPASDPPSWTGSISRVASGASDESYGQVVRRIRAEFLEMPGLCLTFKQAQRLWSLPPHTCEALLQSLIDARFLHRTDRGLFVLRRVNGEAPRAPRKIVK